MNKKILLLILGIILALPVNADQRIPHMVLINLYSICLFALPILCLETFLYKKYYNEFSLKFWIITTIIINAISAFLGLFYGILPIVNGYSTNIFVIMLNCLICCVFSWLIELVLLVLIFNILRKKPDNLFVNVFYVNFISEVLVFLLYSLLFYIPSTNKIFF